MTAREEILRRVQAALVRAPERPSTDTGGNQWIHRDYAHTRDLPDPLALFVERVQDYQATVIRTGPDGVAAAVAKSLAGARRVVVPHGFNPSWVPDDLDVVRDEPALRADELDGVDAVVTSAVVGIAVTGTIVLDHTEGQGRRALTLVPDLHVRRHRGPDRRRRPGGGREAEPLRWDAGRPSPDQRPQRATN